MVRVEMKGELVQSGEKDNTHISSRSSCGPLAIKKYLSSA